MKIQEKSESFCIFTEISCIQSHYLEDEIFRYLDNYSDYLFIYL